MYNSEEHLDKLLNTKLGRLSKAYLKKYNNIPKTILASGTVIYEYDALEVLLTGMELLKKIENTRGVSL